ncbi:MAG: bifunctional [glutamate--ammonia ligase]-adenylyl-L-tyrosine phosphorylase/[glutamate--ammonia-ligase] adenylyltransferase [Gallionella sp.]|nr:bifunctional [glutamate--ammonia ligase]-adenylyl-L-tyrosine phosphorylase/[glutamate--ammonia-ligase] adenylyltransferase [Gallionella sp.]
MNTANSPPATFDGLLQKTLDCSRYAKHALEIDQTLLDWLHENYTTPCNRAEMLALLQQTGLDLSDEAGLSRAVRMLRKRVMVKLILRDLNGLADLNEVMQAMTALAEICIQQAQTCLTQALQTQFGTPLGETNATPQELLIIGMGKLGGGELNVSSDIDLIFVYPEDGETNGSKKLSNHEFFTRLGRRLINIINELTADGYVFRVDMRLRPYGDSGPLVTSFAALEEYLVSQGREWERYAWIKARVVSPAHSPDGTTSHSASLQTSAGKPLVIPHEAPLSNSLPVIPSPQSPPASGRGGERENQLLNPAGERTNVKSNLQFRGEGANESLRDPFVNELMRLAQPFVFRKYLDFGAIDSMRKLHTQIRQEVQRRDRLNNIKLGPGGIREIEFTAQVFQLIRGGRDAALRIRPTRQVLQQLVTDGQLSALAVAGLDAAYVFLRNLEHRLQYLDDQQTQELPEKPEDQRVIALAMNYPDYAALLKTLDRHRALVSQQFEQIFGEQRDEPNDTQLWREEITAEELIPPLEKMGYRAAADSAQRLMQLRMGSRYRQLPELSRQRLDKLIPQFIALSAQHGDPDATLSRLLSILEGISRRAAYLAFLAEYPLALQRLAQVVSASSWASEYLTQHPALLDELLDAREIYQPPQWQQIDHDLQNRLNDCAGDTERQLDVLHHAKQEQTFRLLAMDLQGLLPLEKLSDHLSDLADLLLRHVLALSWMTTRKRHREDAKFAVIAYGKLGGKELGYASDLDLIFLFDDDHPDAQEIYSRLGQRINALLSSYTSSGRLFETDLRLRPNGASGLLVSSVAAFAEYQQQHAWVWEHQALTRARFSAGDTQIGAEFENIRLQVLCQPRDLAVLRKEILAMRQKMRDGHPDDSGLFDIKHGRGGMVDIEFIVQFIVLAYAHQHPQLAANIGNLALLKLAGELGLITVEIAGQTCSLYRTLRQTQHRMRLNNQSPCRVPPGEVDTHASQQLWAELFGRIA